MLFTFHLTDILTAILYGTMFSSDIASAAFRASSSLRKQQNTATKKIDFLPLAVRSARIMRADYTRLCAECTARADSGRWSLSRSLARSTLRARIADPANATNGKRPGRDRGPAIKSPTNDKQISHSGSPIYRCCNTLPHT